MTQSAVSLYITRPGPLQNTLLPGMLVRCPGNLLGTVHQTDGHYVQVLDLETRQENWYPADLLLSLNPTAGRNAG